MAVVSRSGLEQDVSIDDPATFRVSNIKDQYERKKEAKQSYRQTSELFINSSFTLPHLLRNFELYIRSPYNT